MVRSSDCDLSLRAWRESPGGEGVLSCFTHHSYTRPDMSRDLGDVHDPPGALSVEQLSQSKPHDLCWHCLRRSLIVVCFDNCVCSCLCCILSDSCLLVCGLGLSSYDNKVLLESLHRIGVTLRFSPPNLLHACVFVGNLIQTRFLVLPL